MTNEFLNMKVAIKQPYFMPYLGYFQLVKHVDTYVFYDDVNYYKGGYINRNNVLVNNCANLIILPVKNSSRNMLINEVEILREDKLYKNALKTIYMAYKKAPYFDFVYPMIERIFNSDAIFVSEFAQLSIIEVAGYLNFKTKFIVSSEHFSHNRGIEKEQRLIDICKEMKAKTYVCDVGGKEIYRRENFLKEGIDMYFFEPQLSAYDQFNNNFVPALSIIDVLMFNSIEKVNAMLDKFELS